MFCTVEGLEPATPYAFQLASFREVNGVWTNTTLSNVEEVHTSGQVRDLRLVTPSSTSLRVAWTQTDDHTGNPANYRVKYATPTIDWRTGTVACTKQGTEIGAQASCVITGLSPATPYQVRLMSYRVENGVWVDSRYSNVLNAMTLN
jgi:hypothetical protein